jgi:hypothetical protein
VAPLEVEGSLGRGLRPPRAGGLADPDRCASLSPTVFERARHEGEWLSGHDPILVDVAF